MSELQIFENSPDGMFLLNPEGQILKANRQASELFQYTEEELLNNQAEILLPERFRRKNVFLKEQKKEIYGLRKDRVEFPIDIILSSISIEEKTIILCIIRDITERKRSDLALKESQRMFQELFENSPDAIIVVDDQGRIKQLNTQLEKLFGYKREELYGQTIEILMPSRFHDIHVSHRREYFHHPHRRQMGVGLDLFGRKKDGTEFNVDIMLSPIQSSEQASTLAVIRDITEKKKAETELEESSKKNAVLLREIHHRVKNNLQIISSLLHIQTSHISDASAIEILNEACGRVRTIALIHEKLYQSTDFSKINFSDYIKEFSKEFFHAHLMTKKDFQFDQQVENIYFSIETAIPCSLIINEILANSIKYAFPKNQKGKIWLKMLSIDGSYLLEIGDNGIGFPKDFDLAGLSTFGLKLIQDLVKQLNGTLKIKNENGAVYTIIFKESVYKKKYKE